MAEKTLVVVESPAKAKTINKYLGKNYVVQASVGHIKDLTKFKLGVDIENGFTPKYQTIRGKADVIKQLKLLAKTSGKVLIATDPDREGEAIAWHLAQEIKTVNPEIKRVIFNEITKNGIKKGIEKPREIDENIFMSQQARRVMDRLIGYQVSPFLSRAMIAKTSQSLSAGRVQSVALRLICERELLVRGFEPIEYWNIGGDFDFSGSAFKAKLVAFDGKSVKNPEGSGKGDTDESAAALKNDLLVRNYIKNEEQASDLIKRIKSETYAIADVTKKQVKRKPLSPFTTSLIQQEASRRLGFSNKKTMMVAQKLYEGVNLGTEGQVGLITYMRTDSVRISEDVQQAARGFIAEHFGEDFIPAVPPVYTSKSSNVQDAHEAIRPTDLVYSPQSVRQYLDKDEAALYELVYNRFLASQMNPAVLDQTTVNIKGGDFVFRATGSVVVFKGFLAVYDDLNEDKKKEKEDSAVLPSGLEAGKPTKLEKVTKNQSFTKPPARYNEASLVKELDELGIGRPSTYAQIVSTLIDREYVELMSKAFIPTDLGMDVNVILVKSFPDLFNVDFTAKMEDELDIIAEGDKTYEAVLTDFYGPFTSSLKYAEENSDVPEIICEICGAPMLIKVSRRGRFLGCSKYPECTSTRPLPKSEKELAEKKEPVLAVGVKCDLCGGDMYIREGKFGRFMGCASYPECKGIKQITSDTKCPKCKEGNIVERYSPKSRKKFWGCSAYPKCDFITNYEPLEQKCPHCGNDYLEVRYKKTESGYDKYLNCPACKEKIEAAQEKKA